MTESFTKKRVLNSVAVHKKQSARVLTAPAHLLACSLQAFPQKSDPVNVNDDTGPSLPVLVKTPSTSNGDTTDAEGKYLRVDHR